ncbi:hypothetical protein [Maribacter halichondriae]|uniref:hypothetical protein n=1 Tax=Maribacter halichondriae TaxID=2980554 RepID=UPI00235977EA|nr:hypothetical protein [Maribacter sp. Hal144]
MTKRFSIKFLKTNKLALVPVLVFMFGCAGSEYSELVKNEMAKGIVHDSLVFGMKFGQTKKEFFDQCWKLNSKGLISQGPQNQSVKYKLPIKDSTDLKSSMIMLFYGSFDEKNIMNGMDLQFYYEFWAPWNKALQSDKLRFAVKDSLEKWYPGNQFITVEKDNKEMLVKVDGNRRMIIKPLDDEQFVKAKIDDLRDVLEK